MPNAAGLKKEIESFLRDNPKSPAAGSLRSAASSLGGPSPGHQAARDAGSGSTPSPFQKKGADAENPAENAQEGGKEEPGAAKPNSPGADMNSAKAPPFGGIKKTETAKALARLRFKKMAAGKK